MAFSNQAVLQKKKHRQLRGVRELCKCFPRPLILCWWILTDLIYATWNQDRSHRICCGYTIQAYTSNVWNYCLVNWNQPWATGKIEKNNWQLWTLWKIDGNRCPEDKCKGSCMNLTVWLSHHVFRRYPLVQPRQIHDIVMLYISYDSFFKKNRPFLSVSWLGFLVLCLTENLEKRFNPSKEAVIGVCLIKVQIPGVL